MEFKNIIKYVNETALSKEKFDNGEETIQKKLMTRPISMPTIKPLFIKVSSFLLHRLVAYIFFKLDNVCITRSIERYETYN